MTAPRVTRTIFACAMGLCWKWMPRSVPFWAVKLSLSCTGLKPNWAYFGSDHVSMNQPRWSPNTSGSMIFTSGIFVSRIFIVFHLSQ